MPGSCHTSFNFNLDLGNSWFGKLLLCPNYLQVNRYQRDMLGGRQEEEPTLKLITHKHNIWYTHTCEFFIPKTAWNAFYWSDRKKEGIFPESNSDSETFFSPSASWKVATSLHLSFKLHCCIENHLLLISMAWDLWRHLSSSSFSLLYTSLFYILFPFLWSETICHSVQCIKIEIFLSSCANWFWKRKEEKQFREKMETKETSFYWSYVNVWTDSLALLSFREAYEIGRTGWQADWQAAQYSFDIRTSANRLYYWIPVLHFHPNPLIWLFN